MPTVDELVREAIVCYPGLYHNRTQVLHHVLCVVGGGYEWGQDGTPFYRFPEDNVPFDREAHIAQRMELFSNPPLPEYIQEALRADVILDANECAARVADVEKLAHERGSLKSTIYPQSHYALLMNAPENVTPDWLEACNELKLLATEGGWVF